MNIRTRLFFVGALVPFVFLAELQTAGAANVPIVNPSFEQPVLAPGASSSPILGWKPLGGGVLHPVGSPQPSDGSQVAYVDATSPAELFGTIQQVLTTTVAPYMVYTLRADFIGGDFPYTAVLGTDTDALIVGGTPLGPTNFFTVAPHQTKTATQTFEVFPGDPAIGHHLLILANVQFSFYAPATPTPRAYFDNFRLDASPGIIPPPVLHGAFGLHSFVTPETARLKAYCDGSVMPAACDVTLEFTDLAGSLLAQSAQTLQPGTSGFFDLPSARAAGGPGEMIPGFVISRGSAVVSFELLDSLTQRTQILVDWGDGSRPESGDIHFGLAGLTAFDTGRLGANCTADGSVVPPPCNVVFEFQDSQGRLLKQSRTTLQPGTGTFLDLQYSGTLGVGGRTEVLPLIKVTGGAAIGTFAVLDSSLGSTLAEAYPAALAAPKNQ